MFIKGVEHTQCSLFIIRNNLAIRSTHYLIIAWEPLFLKLKLKSKCYINMCYVYLTVDGVYVCASGHRLAGGIDSRRGRG